ncbi:hypothetical protein IFM89_036997 [Coptis chinensis]|uniref:Pentatricopeptide repeat-containing protein n=1 Tax=Coptis chinensis TaxID=261450 RepID=A0A835HJE3_9MAGN|nr:hypothetical protein IFM89_036997 [Coptis chinensis]
MEYAELCWRVHACICKLGHDSNAFVGTALIDAYTVCGFVEDAKEVFTGILDKDMVSWTGMVACYSENGEEALKLFSRMWEESPCWIQNVNLRLSLIGEKTILLCNFLERVVWALWKK